MIWLRLMQRNNLVNLNSFCGTFSCLKVWKLNLLLSAEVDKNYGCWDNVYHVCSEALFSMTLNYETLFYFRIMFTNLLKIKKLRLKNL